MTGPSLTAQFPDIVEGLAALQDLRRDPEPGRREGMVIRLDGAHPYHLMLDESVRLERQDRGHGQ